MVLIMEQFTEEEKTILSRFMTNTDKSIFALKNLPEVVMGALFSRYSRSQKSLRRVLFDEFINKPETGFHEIVNYDVSKHGTDELVAIKRQRNSMIAFLSDSGMTALPNSQERTLQLKTFR